VILTQKPVNDCIIPDETLLDLFKLDSDNDVLSYMLDYENLENQGVPLSRVSQCSCQPNNYGFKLLNLCKKLHIYIASSRIGLDKGIGEKNLQKHKCHRLFFDVVKIVFHSERIRNTRFRSFAVRCT
jgi:hypothetical protein